MGVFITFVLIATIVISTVIDYQINGGGADCGSYGFNFPLPDSMNNCCIEHDKCYDQLKNKMGCDIEIGTCILENCNGPHCVAAPIFTGLTAAFGSETYLDTKFKVLEEIRRKIQINSEEKIFVNRRLSDLGNALNIRFNQLERTGCFRYAMKLNGVPTEMFPADNSNFESFMNMLGNSEFITAKILYKIGSWVKWHNECSVRKNSCNYLPPYYGEPGSMFNSTHRFTWIKTAPFHWENLKGWFSTRNMSYTKLPGTGSVSTLLQNMKSYCKISRKFYSGIELKTDLRIIYNNPDFDDFHFQTKKEKGERERQLSDILTMEKFLNEVRNKFEVLQFPTFSCESPEDCCLKSSWGVWTGSECVDTRP